MENLGWGLQMLVLGMGTVFLMLAVLMVTLTLLNFTDRQPPAAIEQSPEAEASVAGISQAESVDENAWLSIRDASGLTPAQIAAVSVAVAVHADVRRKQGAPVNRVHAPGSRLWASRWVSMGRHAQMRNTSRR